LGLIAKAQSIIFFFKEPNCQIAIIIGSQPINMARFLRRVGDRVNNSLRKKINLYAALHWGELFCHKKGFLNTLY